MTFSLFANKQQHQREIQLFGGADSGGGRVYTSFSQFPPAVRGTPTVVFWKTKKMITGRDDVQAFLQMHQRAKPPQQRATRAARPPAPVEPSATGKGRGAIYDNHTKIATVSHATEVASDAAKPRDLPVVDLPSDLPVDQASKEKSVDAASISTPLEPSVPNSSTEARICDGEDRDSSTASSDPVERQRTSNQDKIDTPPPLDKEESCVDLPSARSMESSGETIDRIERDPPAKKKQTRKRKVRFEDEVDASSPQTQIDETGQTSDPNPPCQEGDMAGEPSLHGPSIPRSTLGEATIDTSAASHTATTSVDLAVEPKRRTRKKKSDAVEARVAEANVKASEEVVYSTEEPAPKKKRAPRKKKVVMEL